ncbi:hypothetical protein PQ472_10480 [Lacticaseibacillus pabuli]|uniref:Tumor necrosis factor receptor superfamily member 19 n=1 Tax=Lacticaseibacillus pabuli TaxID=3025672 RepID=A0ABY7WQ30_9LACO|nr:hypothetical protein [Lacticaseibacillus sp. KACC 23028]WDF82305.1 hypothetical protein PQ472_10480 [Lacticaseibacillus sp. KACC 23028]
MILAIIGLVIFALVVLASKRWDVDDQFPSDAKYDALRRIQSLK